MKFKTLEKKAYDAGLVVEYSDFDMHYKFSRAVDIASERVAPLCAASANEIDQSRSVIALMREIRAQLDVRNEA